MALFLLPFRIDPSNSMRVVQSSIAWTFASSPSALATMNICEMDLCSSRCASFRFFCCMPAKLWQQILARLLVALAHFRYSPAPSGSFLIHDWIHMVVCLLKSSGDELLLKVLASRLEESFEGYDSKARDIAPCLGLVSVLSPVGHRVCKQSRGNVVLFNPWWCSRGQRAIPPPGGMPFGAQAAFLAALAVHDCSILLAMLRVRSMSCPKASPRS